ncbi:MAG: VCBS repeat-containing protein [Planctomycetota bacterium]
MSTLCALLLGACGGESDAPAPASAPPAGAAEASAPPRVELPTPRRALQGVTRNEGLAEVVTDWLIALAQKVQIRDFDGMRGWFTEDFQGEDPWASAQGAAGARTEDLPLGVQRTKFADLASGVFGRDAFVDQVAGHIGDWQRVTQAQIKLLSVVFEDAKRVEWGRAQIKLHIVGERAEGGFDSLTAKGEAKLVNIEGEWRIALLRIDSRERLARDSASYSEVSRATGVAYDGPAFGAPGNDTVAWNGAASADVDGDGRFDIFVPSGLRSFLYLNRGDGTFSEEAEARGLAADVGGTGAVFFDFDRDGDQDLAVGHIGWVGLERSLGGAPLALYENDGRGHFREVAAERGFDKRLAAYTLTVFDADGDGWQDVYACGYGRMEVEANDSWIRASNGESDLFLRNVEGRFVDATKEAGFGDSGWSYASAAADFDADGDQDLFVANNFGPCQLWRNRGDGTFEDVAKELGVDAAGIVMGCNWADLNHDGHLDLYLSSPTSVAGSRMLAHLDLDGRDRAAANLRQHAIGNRIFFGDDRGGFSELPAGHGAASAGWGFGAAMTDLDLDGALDIACVNGFVTGDLTADT